MRTRLLALSAVGASLAAVMVGGASPATAQPGANCGAYPPGNAYGIRANTNGITARVVQVRTGSTVRFTARVFRNGENCSGRRVVFFVHGPREFNADGSSAYHASASAITDNTGLAVVIKTVSNSFRWYAGYSSDNGTGIASTKGGDRLIQAV
ncbi:MAG: hypothetical protein JJD92_07035 [Frankiaceae bacterium]|nr:hypothetical protein [Frankiaceae bacterium]